MFNVYAMDQRDFSKSCSNGTKNEFEGDADAKQKIVRKKKKVFCMPRKKNDDESKNES